MLPCLSCLPCLTFDLFYVETELCEDVTKLKKLRVPELNKHLNHHGLKQHLKSNKSEKVKVIVRHCLLTAVKRTKERMMSMTVMPLTLGEMIQVMSFLH